MFALAAALGAASAVTLEALGVSGCAKALAWFAVAALVTHYFTRGARPMTYDSDVTVRELLLCATNEGAFYDRFLRAARLDMLAPEGRGIIGALEWLGSARDYLTLYRRQHANGSFKVTAEEALGFSAALAEYYADHLTEWSPDDLIALDVRLGLKPAT